MTDQELQSLRNLGNEAEAAADEIERQRAEIAALRAACSDLLLWVDTSREGPSRAAEQAHAAMQRGNKP